MGIRLAASLLALMIGAASVGGMASERLLRVPDALAALKAAGATETYIPTEATNLDALILVTGGADPVSYVSVEVLPTVRAAQAFAIKRNAPYSIPKPLRIIIPKPMPTLPAQRACNVDVWATLPEFTVAHPSAADRRELRRIVATIRAAQQKVISNLQHRRKS